LYSIFSSSQFRVSSFFQGRPVVFRFERLALGTRASPAQWRELEKEAGARIRSEVRSELEKRGVRARDGYLSTSHSRSQEEGGIVVVGSDCPLGVDLEDCERRVSTRVIARVLNTSEKRFLGGRIVNQPASQMLQDTASQEEGAIASLSLLQSGPLIPLELWVIKEAIYKANPGNPGTLIPQYRLTDWNDASQIGEAGHFVDGIQKAKFKILLIRQTRWRLALARLV
jgi:hypothetical protein